MVYEDVSTPGEGGYGRGEAPPTYRETATSERGSALSTSERKEAGKFFTLVVAALVFAIAAFILVTTWLVVALNLIFGPPTGSFILAALFLLGAVWAGVTAKKVIERQGGIGAMLAKTGAAAREVTEPARRGYRGTGGSA